MTRQLNISEAARHLEVSEGTLRRWTDAGQLPCERTAQNYRRFNLADLDEFAIRRNLGATARAQRTIIFVGHGLAEQKAALEAAGLHVAEAANVIDGIRAAQHRGAPIVVINKTVAHDSTALVKALLGDASFMVVTSSQHDVPWEIEPQVVVCDPTELRRLTHWCWGKVKARHEAVTLGL